MLAGVRFFPRIILYCKIFWFSGLCNIFDVTRKIKNSRSLYFIGLHLPFRLIIPGAVDLLRANDLYICIIALVYFAIIIMVLLYFCLRDFGLDYRLFPRFNRTCSFLVQISCYEGRISYLTFFTDFSEKLATETACM